MADSSSSSGAGALFRSLATPLPVATVPRQVACLVGSDPSRTSMTLGAAKRRLYSAGPQCERTPSSTSESTSLLVRP